MSIANALGLTDEQFMNIVEERKNSFAVKYGEKALQRKLTDEEVELVALDCEISKRLNTGNTEALKRYGIEIKSDNASIKDCGKREGDNERTSVKC